MSENVWCVDEPTGIVIELLGADPALVTMKAAVEAVPCQPVPVTVFELTNVVESWIPELSIIAPDLNPVP
ncbi:MAG TPA: hypothetical protein VKE70_36895 [Candidatus Solibacter sp.]|nr:hypothetical protein [Candidatus Solibacter sp.]